MGMQRLEGIDAFVVTDLDDLDQHAGVVRCAPKVLADSAWLLARCVTYQFASLERPVGGASVGINAKPDDRSSAVPAAIERIASLEPPLVLDAGRGIGDADLTPLRGLDGRTEAHLSRRTDLTAVGIVAALGSQRPLDGLRLALDHVDDLALDVARHATTAGALIVAASVGGTVVVRPEGIGPDQLTDLARGSGDATALGLATTDTAVHAVEADALAIGSKLGALDHTMAADVRAGVVVPTGWVPVTTRALAVLTRNGVTVLPDFVVLAGAVPDSGVGGPVADDGVGAASTTVVDLLADIAPTVGDAWPNLVLAACARAEAYLTASGRELPSSRPLG